MRTVPQTPPPAPAVANQQSSVARAAAAAAAAAVANPCHWCLSAVISHQLKRQDPHFPAHRRALLCPPGVSCTDTAHGTLSTPTKRPCDPASESESEASPQKRARPDGEGRAGGQSRGAAGVAIAAKPSWSWSSRSWGPAAAVTCSACCTASPSSTIACLTTWGVAARRPSSRWSSWTARWAGRASASERSAPERPPSTQREREREDRRCLEFIPPPPVILSHTHLRTVLQCSPVPSCKRSPDPAQDTATWNPEPQSPWSHL
ncbi:hypothetical protein ANANG_G00119140 [Anguilla anguilla]|uniref:Uncharacterized protein n=1 Tax=Anguilla anguilla TaxID=7936 RepID=A0A9D3MD73_ANGAN|nr:hypothetical protein ANANG_G00119140 [Anguilla anguilla]